jgi:hypothetical protein
VSLAHPGLRLGRIGAWLNPGYGDDARTGLAIQAESLGFADADFDDGGSDRLIDALVLHGSPDIIAAGLRSHLDAGADHVAIQVLTGNGNDPIPAPVPDQERPALSCSPAS